MSLVTPVIVTLVEIKTATEVKLKPAGRFLGNVLKKIPACQFY